MPIIALKAEDVTKNPPAKPNNAVVPKSPSKGSVPESDSEDATLLFSKELASKINPKRPDITAAIILYGLHLWQKAFIFGCSYVPMVNGQRGSYQSLSQLQESYPWLTEEGIRMAINRAEKALKGQFIVDRGNPGAERGKLHFWISPDLIKKYRFNADKMGLLQLRVNDAVQYGVLEAVLLSNLEYVTDKEHNSSPLKDEQGKIYRELSPSKLTKLQVNKDGVMKKILPSSRDAVINAIARLKDTGALIEHGAKAGFYRLKDDSDTVVKVAGPVVKVASGVVKVASETVPVALEPCKHQGSEAIDRSPYTNTGTIPDTKCITPIGSSLRSSPTAIPSDMSSSARKLMELVVHDLAVIRQRNELAPQYP